MNIKEIKEIINRHIKIREKHNIFDIYEKDTEFNEYDYIDSFTDLKPKKNINKKTTILYNFFMLPMLFLHELSHYIVALLLLIRPNRFFISNPLKSSSGFISFHTENYIKRIIIMLAPILIIITAIILPFIFTNGIYFTLYTLLSFRKAIPSIYDIIFVKILWIVKKNLSAFELNLISMIIFE